MCGIAGVVHLRGHRIPGLRGMLATMSGLIAHRGPDDDDLWTSTAGSVGLAHRRLSIIDVSAAARQPMHGPNGTVVVHNGEIYNYLELRGSLARRWEFRTSSDTETILASYDRHGERCVERLRGMFGFALWDEKTRRLLCARDRFGIKPFYYTVLDDLLIFASEIKALLPFMPEIATDTSALAEYLTFQYTLGEATLFSGIKQLLPGHRLTLDNGKLRVKRYWDVHYDIDYDHSAPYFERRLTELVGDSIEVHLRSDVPLGSYLSGGIDSSLVAILASRADPRNELAFHGKFTDYAGYDESGYAVAAAESAGKALHQIEITAADFEREIANVIYHLDHPVAGPGSFPQYMVSGLASKHVKVVLGGQGGDEIFGGYARYLIAYFEQCIKAAIDGTYRDGHFIVTAESIIPNLGVLREYKPLLRAFWQEGMFESLDRRYFRLIDRSADMRDEVDWSALDREAVFESFGRIFNSTRNVRHEAYFDSMTHFDLKCLLPALLHVEDRMSMAHGLESRVPFLDHALIEFVATVPADVKFKNGHMKHLLRSAYANLIPEVVLGRRDKMGFPVPLKEWFAGPLKDYVNDVFGSERARSRPLFNAAAIRKHLQSSGPFSRKAWGLLSLELWHQQFHDRAAEFRGKVEQHREARSPRYRELGK